MGCLLMRGVMRAAKQREAGEGQSGAVIAAVCATQFSYRDKRAERRRYRAGELVLVHVPTRGAAARTVRISASEPLRGQQCSTRRPDRTRMVARGECTESVRAVHSLGSLLCTGRSPLQTRKGRRDA